MDLNSPEKNGLLEQYLLGLTTREETQEVEEYLASNPEARQELEFLRRQLGLYLEEKGIDEKNEQGTSVDDEDSGEVVLAYLLERNQRLNATRLILLSICALLLAGFIYLYRQNSLLEAELLTERARHVQDDRFHETTLKELSRTTVSLDSLCTVVAESEHGNLQLHYLTADSVLLIDLSHLAVPDTGFAYHIHLLNEGAEVPRYVVERSALNSLYPVEQSGTGLRVLYGPARPDTLTPSPPQPDLVAELSLARPARKPH